MSSGFGNFYPKGKDSNSEQEDRKGDSGDTKDKEKKAGDKKSAGGGSGGGPQFGAAPDMPESLMLLVLSILAFALLSKSSMSSSKEISWQEFKRDLLFKGKVERLEVVNKTTCRVYLRPDTQVQGFYLWD